jgi:hypothetical protein
MARRARNAPSPARVRRVVALCFAPWDVEIIWGWPEALTVNLPAKL